MADFEIKEHANLLSEQTKNEDNMPDGSWSLRFIRVKVTLIVAGKPEFTFSQRYFRWWVHSLRDFSLAGSYSTKPLNRAVSVIQVVSITLSGEQDQSLSHTHRY